MDYVWKVYASDTFGGRHEDQLGELSYKDKGYALSHGCWGKSAFIAILIQHGDPGIQELYYEQFLELKDLLHSTLEEEWQWQLHVPGDAGKVVTRIYKEISGVSVFNKDHWPELISFSRKGSLRWIVFGSVQGIVLRC